MQTNDLYQLAEEHNHDVVTMHLKESSAFAIEDDNHVCHIAISDKLSGIEEKEALAHELGHCENGGFYNYYSPYEIRSKCEAKANRWSYFHLIPFDKLREAINKGCSSIWELAEHFDVSPEFAANTLRFYIEQLGNKLN